MTPSHEKQLIRSILLLAAAGVLAVGICTSVLSASLFLERMKEGARANVTHAADVAALSVSQYLRRSTDIVWQITSRSSARSLLALLNAGAIDSAEYQRETLATFTDALSRSDNLLGIVRLSASHTPAASYGERIPQDLLPTREDVKKDAVISRPFDLEGNTRMIVYAPIHDNQGAYLGADVAMFRLDELARLLRAKNSESRFDWDMHVFLAVGNGISATYYQPFDASGKPLRPTEIDTLVEEGHEVSVLDQLDDQTLSLGRYFFAARDIEDGDWHVVVRKSTDMLYGAVHRDIAISFAALIVLTATGALGFLLLIRHYAARLSRAVGGLRSDIQSSQTLYEDLIEGSVQGIMIHRDYRPLMVNKSWAESHGYTVEEVMGVDSIKDFFAPEDQERMEQYRRARLIGNEAPGRYEYQAVHRDGSKFWVEIFARRIIWKGEPAIQATIGDISERKRQEALDAYYREELENLVRLRTAEIEEKSQGLETALKKEREYNALMEQFVAMASHEFRTPLTIIDSVAQRLIRRADRLAPEDITQGALKTRSGVQRMIKLIEGLLHSARMDAGKLSLNPRTCNLAEIIQRVCEREREISTRHEITEQIEDLPTKFYGDPTMIEQVFCNLLSNASKYSPDNPKISVVSNCSEEAVSISITDSGVGIPADEIPKLFDRFFRASTSSGIAGTGIGLNLVAQIVELHGGQVTVESIEGQGSTFCVHLPLFAVANDSLDETNPAGEPKLSPDVLQPAVEVA